jgi:phosphoribosylformylglycinamidine synthase
VDLGHERRVGNFIGALIRDRRVTTVHDVSDGGVAVAVAEMALAGSIGARVQTYGDHRTDFFSEDQGRYLLCVSDERAFERVQQDALAAGIKIEWIGETGGDSLVFMGDQDNEVGRASLATLRAAHEGFFPKLMGSELTPDM